MSRNATSLALTWAPSRPSSRTRMRFRPFQRHHLGGQNMRELAGAAAESQRADAADRAGVTVGHRMRRARQHDAEFRRHDM